MFLIAIPRLLAVVALSSVLSCAPSESLDRSKSQKETEEGDLNFGKIGKVASTSTSSNNTSSSNTGAVSSNSKKIDDAIEGLKPAGDNIDLSALRDPRLLGPTSNAQPSTENKLSQSNVPLSNSQKVGPGEDIIRFTPTSVKSSGRFDQNTLPLDTRWSRLDTLQSSCSWELPLQLR